MPHESPFALDPSKTREMIFDIWDKEITPKIEEYIRIPNQSPDFDAQWKEHGYMDEAVELARSWIEKREIPGSRLRVLQLPERTPLLLMEIDGELPGTIFLYGHLDKQPAFKGWRTEEGLGPWTPVIQDGKLYGRGGADDGYAAFASVAAVEAIKAQNIPHPRLVMIIECSEESGSPDLPAYMNEYADDLGEPDLIVCLDSGCGDYDRLWSTTSLRGIMVGVLNVKVLHEGVHSGDASGVVPSSFRVARSVMSRIEDPETGKIIPEELWCQIPQERLDQAKSAADVLGTAGFLRFPFVEGMKPADNDPAELILNRTWRPTLSVTGQGGLPSIEQGGNVLRPGTSLKFSFRLPPKVNAKQAAEVIKEQLEKQAPYGAHIEFEIDQMADGWEAPATAPWLEKMSREASETYFGNSACSMGEGGSIPFMGMLGEQFPKAQFLITGVLGPQSNAHGPNEFLHLDCAKKVTCCVAHIIAGFGEEK